ncbi:hypothetical protein [Streptomyces violascens]|uniref:hypothetical protein n=1 Tax=Streptomyces violascens TaxID=67381 RepID=UPI0036947F7C
MASARLALAARHGVRPVVGCACAAAVAAGLLAAGCSAALTGSAGQVTPPVIQTTSAAPATGYDGLTQLPLSAYGTSEEDDLLRYRTNQALIARCMKSLGHAGYTSRNPAPATIETEATIRGDRIAAERPNGGC